MFLTRSAMMKGRRLVRLIQNLPIKSIPIYLLGWPIRRYKRKKIKEEILKKVSLADRFTLIYERNLWLSNESTSGSGSSNYMTQSISKNLPLLIEKFNIKTILDAPCGDFSWMRRIELKDVIYTGVDIVKQLIEELNWKYSTENVSFKILDITKDALPKNDLVLTRDCLFHFSNRDILLFLSNFLESQCKYLLTTSYSNESEFINSDIFSGDFRLIDLFIKPFEFPLNYKYRIPEPSEGMLPSRNLFLWDREQIVSACNKLENYLSE